MTDRTFSMNKGPGQMKAQSGYQVPGRPSQTASSCKVASCDCVQFKAPVGSTACTVCGHMDSQH